MLHNPPTLRKAVPTLSIAAIAAALLLAGSPASTVARRLPAKHSRHHRVHHAKLTRYSLVNGCFALHSPGSGAPIGASYGPFRMQAAALGVYLLYGPAGDYLADAGSGSVAGVGTPSPSTEWRVDGTVRRGFTLTNLGNGSSRPVSFTRAGGCAVYPEAQLDATGPAFKGASPEAGVLGTMEGHAHITAFEFFGGDWHCGRPWSPYGAPYALPASCAADEQGSNGEVEAFLDFGGPSRPNGMHGWPTFVDWPSPTTLAEEGDYYTGIERAWKAGLRLMVTNLVDNEALCSIMTKRHNPCNDMAAVHIQSRDLYALQDYIDAQSGGPGKGWFRIVTDPFQARRVINEGKLAVIEGVEVSRIFGCGERGGAPQCDQSQIDAGLKDVYALGVRTFFPIHEFDNAFGGTKMIAGEQGTIVNAGNRLETGSYWTLQPCPAQDQDAEQMTTEPSGTLAQLLNGPVSSLLGGNPVPVYGSGPQCNVRGITSLGVYLIHQMIKQHFIIQTDHMDSKTAAAAVAIAQAEHYSGVVSAHCCSSPQLFQEIYDAGGFVNPPVQPAASFVATWQKDKALSDPRYHFGFGWGSDENGLADQPGPSATPAVSYPFKSWDHRVTFTREQWGQRLFDFGTDGLANYGMYADWLHQLQLSGPPQFMNDMFQGAEAYLEMWERADGVPATSCFPVRARFTGGRLGHVLRLGERSVAALYSAGQPLSRPGRSYRYCVGGSASSASARRPAVSAAFNRHGRVALIASTARGYSAGGVRPGASVARLRSSAHSLATGVWVSRRGRYVYGVRSGRVWFVGVSRDAGARLRADVRAAGL